MRLAILTHATDSIQPERYLIHALAGLWRARGVDVAIHQGLRAPIAADAAILHVDRTRVPGRYLRAIAACPVALNGDVADISKPGITTLRVRRGDGYAGPVIVKSTLNHGGVPEFEGWRNSRRLRALTRLEHLPWWLTGMFLPRLRGYPIYASPAAVPAIVWFNPRLIVERLAVERAGDGHILWHWAFLGDCDFHYRDIRAGAFPARGSLVERTLAGPPPPELRAVRSRLGFDYGKFDYAIVDGRVVLYDCNRTPGMAFARAPRFARALEEFSHGLEAAIVAASARRPTIA